MSAHMRSVVMCAVAGTLLIVAIPAGRLLARQSPTIDAALFRELQWQRLGTSPGAANGAAAVRVVTDSAFPFRACIGRLDGPAACVSTARAEETGTGTWTPVSRASAPSIASDPTDPDVVFTASADDGVRRFDRKTDQAQDVTPLLDTNDRIDARAPIVFAPAENRTLYFGTTRVWKSTNSGQSWVAVSATLPDHGTMSSLAPSPIDGRTMWAGTSAGAVQVSRDGTLTWHALVMPPATAAMRVSAIEPSHFDASTAYVAMTSASTALPSLWRTRDGGATWTSIVTGLPERAATHVVREDQFRRGLLFAGTDEGALVSFDDGDHWQTLRMNMPAAPVVDITIRDADVVAVTAGQGLWMLNDIAPLRQVTPDIARANTFLFRPSTAWRMRASLAADHAPRSAVALHYLIGPNVSSPVTIEIIESVTGDVIRRFSSTPADDASPDVTPISGAFGLHRVWWDLSYTPIDSRGVAVLPGVYQVRLTAGGTTLRQAVSVRIDPRIRAAAPEITAQYKLARAIDDQRRQISMALRQAAATSTDTSRDRTLRAVMAALNSALDRVQQSDAKPTSAAEAAAGAAIAQAVTALAPVAPIGSAAP